LHFPDGYPWLTLSAILSCEARTFLTVIPFGNIPRDRSTRLRLIIPQNGDFVKHKFCGWIFCFFSCFFMRDMVEYV